MSDIVGSIEVSAMDDTRNLIQEHLSSQSEEEIQITLFIPNQNEKYGMVYAVEFTTSGKNEKVSWFFIDDEGKVNELAASELSDTIEIG
jgi:hypothetical protein